jgi:uncharacterized Zn finger protein
MYGSWAPYVSVAERRRKAALAMAKRKKQGHAVSPVLITGRTIATTFWGKSWCSNLENYSDYENRLPRGRTYARNGSVVDLQIDKGIVTALVSGSSLYSVNVKVEPVPQARWSTICKDVAGAIDSLVELLQGTFSKGVMDRLCQQESGLFPSPKQIRFSCSCPDSASMCKHIAAVLYGIGARLDNEPALLFKLRTVDETQLVAQATKGIGLAGAKKTKSRARISDDSELSELFGIELAPKAKAPKAKAPKAQKAKVLKRR